MEGGWGGVSKFIIKDLSLGSQLVKTVRSLLSLMLSQGMSSSSGDRDMAFTLSSRLNTLQNKGGEKMIRWLGRWTEGRSPGFPSPPPSHVSFQEQIQEHPLGPDLGKVQRMVQSVSECNELWDFLKGSILVSLDDIL